MNLIKIITSILLFNMPVLFPVVIEPSDYIENSKFWKFFTVYLIVTVLFTISDEINHILKLKKYSIKLLFHKIINKAKHTELIEHSSFIIALIINAFQS